MPDQNVRSAQAAFAIMLRRCADYVESLPQSDVDALLNGDLEVRVTLVSKKHSRQPKQRPALDAAQLAELASRLRSLNSRAEGERVLEETVSSRSGLEAVARHLRLPARREDRREDLVQRIIEGTIGFRLSSAAVQGRSTGARSTEDSSSLFPQTKKE